MRTPRPLFTLALAALISGCSAPEDPAAGTEATRAATSAPADSDTAAVFTAMDSVYARFTRAYELAEPDSVVALYTDAPLYLPGQGTIVTGAAALGRQFGFLREGIEDGSVRRIRFESVERGASGSLAYDIGYYILRREAPDGSLGPASRGKFATVWRRQDDGGWKIHVDAYSPAPPPE